MSRLLLLLRRRIAAGTGPSGNALLLNDGASFLLLNDGSSQLLLNS